MSLTKGMRLPTEEEQQYLKSVMKAIPFNDTNFRVVNDQKILSVLELDPFPEPDKRGWRRADGWRIHFQCEALPNWANLVDSMHGGATAMLIDVCQSACLTGLQTPTFWGPPLLGGVSIGLDIQFYHAIPVGTQLIVKVVVVKITPTIAQLNCEIVDKESGKVYAFATQVKAWKDLSKSRAKL